MLNLRRFIKPAIVVALLGAIIFLGVYVRSSTLNSKTVLDYDPWFFYRHAEEIVENGYNIPKWDTLSYYPPGRPYAIYQGWPLTIALMFKFLGSFISISLMQVAKIAPLILVGLIPIPAFFIGRVLSNNIGGLVAAIFSVLTPTFISVSMAGYADSDVVVVFYMLLSVLMILLSIKYSRNKFLSIPLYILTSLSILLFAFNWSAGWLPLILFTAFIPVFIIVRVLEEILHQKKMKLHLKSLLPDFKNMILPLLIILIITNILGYIFLHRTIVQSIIGGLTFTGIGGEPLIVNISVAELQTINIFTKAGFMSVAARVGMLPTLAFIGLPLLVIYKIYRREKINFAEIFLFLWAMVSFYLIAKGVRFSLLFSVSAALSSGYVIGNLFRYLKNRHILIYSTVFALIGALIFMSISTSFQVGAESASGLAVSQNWYNAMDWLKTNANKDALIATWWDPGHILAGYTGLKTFADGSHCWYGDCIPYGLNTRIQDMGKLMSTNNETESLQLIEKYTHLTDEQCNAARKVYDDKMPADACKDVPEVYVLATSDLIGKYYWMSCFGSFDMKLWNTSGGAKWKCDGRNFITIPLSNIDSQGLPVYSQGDLTITLLQNGTDILAVLNSPSQGIRNALVSDVVFYYNGVRNYSKANVNGTINGMVLVDPSFRAVIFMDQSVRDSIFTHMYFFDGEGLKNFELMYSNPEVKIFKAKLS